MIKKRQLNASADYLVQNYRTQLTSKAGSSKSEKIIQQSAFFLSPNKTQMYKLLSFCFPLIKYTSAYILNSIPSFQALQANTFPNGTMYKQSCDCICMHASMCLLFSCLLHNAPLLLLYCYWRRYFPLVFLAQRGSISKLSSRENSRKAREKIKAPQQNKVTRGRRNTDVFSTVLL